MRKVKFVKNNFYHIYNRGVEKRDIFKDDSDRWRFIQGMYLFNDEKTSSNILWKLENEKGGLNFRTLTEYIKNNKEERKPLIKFVADSLMPNHFHFLVKENIDGGISSFMHKFGIGYTKYFNKKYNRVGSLFQGPFKAVLVDNELYLKYLLVYIDVINSGQLIEPNLKEEGVKDVDKVLEFAKRNIWSTSQEHFGIRNSIIIEKDIFKDFFSTIEEYKNFCREILLGKKINGIENIILE